MDLSGDGGVLKKILREGKGVTPEDGMNVTVHYTGTLVENGQKFDSSVERGDPFTFVLGNGSVIKGWDVGVKTMRAGEKAVLTCQADYAYGERGMSPNIPGGAALNFEVELLSFEETEPKPWEMSSEQKYEFCLRKRREGNEQYKTGDVSGASTLYKKATEYYSSSYGMNDDEKQKMHEATLPCHLNLAQCFLKMKEYRKAIESCDKSLEIDGDNIKGLFRRGQSCLAIAEYDASRKDFSRILELEPENATANAELARVNRIESDALKKEKAMYAKMFQ